jgi:glutathione S-transferase
MSTNESPSFLPSDPEQRRAIKAAIQEAVDSMVRADAERAFQKEVFDNLKDKFAIAPKQARKYARAQHKDTFAKILAEAEELANMRETLNPPKHLAE